ncbi:MAG: ABC transporter permease, partial [Reyranellales bacterium]
MAVVTPPDYSAGASAAGASRPAAVARLFSTMAGMGVLGRMWWTCLSIGLFVGIWELCWLVGWADPKLLPPPHVFIGSIADQGKFFNTATRWQVGNAMNGGPSAFESVMVTIGATTMRVFSGLLIASVLAISIGVLVRYYTLFDKLVLPTVTLLSPVSPIAWLPVAIFIFGIGNGPAIFMVVVALFFHLVLATITQIDTVS